MYLEAGGGVLVLSSPAWGHATYLEYCVRGRVLRNELSFQEMILRCFFFVFCFFCERKFSGLISCLMIITSLTISTYLKKGNMPGIQKLMLSADEKLSRL